jgi:hypothetical protein
MLVPVTCLAAAVLGMVLLLCLLLLLLPGEAACVQVRWCSGNNITIIILQALHGNHGCSPVCSSKVAVMYICSGMSCCCDGCCF